MKLVVIIFVFLFNIIFVNAEEQSGYLSNTHINVEGNEIKKLSDNNYNTIEKINLNSILTVSNEKPFDKIYIIYSMNSSKGTIKYNNKEKKLGENSFLHELINLDEEVQSVDVQYNSDVEIKEIYVFSKDLPDWVEDWSLPCREADVLLFTAHSDDEHIFFAGLIPYMLNRGKSVQVVYLTRHLKTPIRYDEQLAGLWAVGLRNYPILGPVPDAFSKSIDMALENLKSANMSIDDVVHFEVDMIRKFRPKIVVSHDENGEYGHGQHRLATYALEKSLEHMDDVNYKSVYNPYKPYKIYLHLYNQNQIVMDYDKPLEKYNGKSAFRVSMEGLSKHKSQLRLIWGKWIKYNSVDDVKEYNPKYFGLYYSSVGYENKDNDMFYNIPEKQIMEYSHGIVTQKNVHKKTIKKAKSNNKIDSFYAYITAGIIILLIIIDIYIIIAKK